MGIDIRREFIQYVNPNDCWILVLSRVSGKDYNDIRQEMYEKGYENDTGLKSMHVNEVLRHYGYRPVLIYVPRRRAVIKDILEYFYDNEVVICSMNLKKNLPHLSYGYKGVDYTTSEVDSSMYDPILYAWVKGFKNTRKIHTSL